MLKKKKGKYVNEKKEKTKKIVEEWKKANNLSARLTAIEKILGLKK